MKAHLAYLRVLLKHKWYVFLECLRCGVPLWRAIIHDWSKFSRAEWSAYVDTFFHTDGSPRKVRDKDGLYDPMSISGRFNYAWLHHFQVNAHHWQHWIIPGNESDVKILPMPETYIREMLADWAGAGRAYSGKLDPHGWYKSNGGKIFLHPITRARLEDLMNHYYGALQ